MIKKTPAKVISYVGKDGDYLTENIDVVVPYDKEDDCAPSKKGVGRAVYMLMKAGMSIGEIADKNPGYTSFCMTNKKKLEDYQYSELDYRRRKAALLEWKELSLEGLNEQDMKIAKWLNENIKKPRVLRQSQLYIHGPKMIIKFTILIIFQLLFISHTE